MGLEPGVGETGIDAALLLLLWLCEADRIAAWLKRCVSTAEETVVLASV